MCLLQHEACNHGYVGVTSLLLDHGALVNIPGFDNDTPLHDAVSNGHVEIASVLVTRGANVNIRLVPITYSFIPPFKLQTKFCDVRVINVTCIL